MEHFKPLSYPLHLPAVSRKRSAEFWLSWCRMNGLYKVFLGASLRFVAISVGRRVPFPTLPTRKLEQATPEFGNWTWIAFSFGLSGYQKMVWDFGGKAASWMDLRGGFGENLIIFLPAYQQKEAVACRAYASPPMIGWSPQNWWVSVSFPSKWCPQNARGCSAASRAKNKPRGPRRTNRGGIHKNIQITW